jgi:tripartite-type tricarboxylate transporter receptor subunit TctC
MVVKLTPGAGGQKGAREVAQAKPDGYTLLFGHNLIDQLQPHTERLSYDPLRAFITVWKLNDSVPVLYTATDGRFANLLEVIDYGRENPGKVIFPTSGKWGFSFTIGAMIMSATGLRMNMISYQGGGPVKAALLAGSGDLSSAPYGSIRSLHEAGKVRLLAVAAPERLALAPDTPTLKELGIDVQGAVMERIVMAPRNTPVERLDLLRNAFKNLYSDDEFLGLLEKMGENINYLNGPDYENLRRSQSATYKALVDELLDN